MNLYCQISLPHRICSLDHPGNFTHPAPARWLNNLEETWQLARKEHKQILLNFSGSDWCGPCIMLRKEVFDDPSFQAFADSTLVLVNIDFPRRAMPLI